MMIKFNYNHLDAETQDRLMAYSKAEVEKQFGESLRSYAFENGIKYEQLLEEEAIKNLYRYTYRFQI